MEPNKRLFIAFSVTSILMVAIFTSIGRSLISLSTPSVILPTLTTTTTDSSTTPSSSLSRIDITPKTVQSVITALQSSDSYYRAVTTSLFWNEGQDMSHTLAELWYHQGVSHVRKVLPSGMVRHDIITAEKQYYWYDGSVIYRTKNSSPTSADLAQHIPTYQTILNLGVESIQVANYQYKEGIPCIYVEATPGPLFYTERFWVSTETGLLVAAETYENGTLLYRMEGYSKITTPLPQNTSFVLPDGTVIIDPNLPHN